MSLQTKFSSHDILYVTIDCFWNIIWKVFIFSWNLKSIKRCIWRRPYNEVGILVDTSVCIQMAWQISRWSWAQLHTYFYDYKIIIIIKDIIHTYVKSWHLIVLFMQFFYQQIQKTLICPYKNLIYSFSLVLMVNTIVYIATT